MAEENGEPKSAVKNGRKLNARNVRVWLAGALSVVVIILVIQNTHAATVRLLFWHLQVPLVILIPFIFLIGLVVGYVIRRKR